MQAREYRCPARLLYRNFRMNPEICGNKAIERASSCVRHVGALWEDVKTPGCRFPPEISHNVAWMHAATPVQVLETPDTQHCSRNNGVCDGRSPPLHSTSPSRNLCCDFACSAIPPRTSALGLSYRPADAPQQIMIALISFDSRLSVLSRDIVTRRHEGQDNSQKNLSADGTDEN